MGNVGPENHRVRGQATDVLSHLAQKSETTPKSGWRFIMRTQQAQSLATITQA